MVALCCHARAPEAPRSASGGAVILAQTPSQPPSQPSPQAAPVPAATPKSLTELLALPSLAEKYQPYFPIGAQVEPFLLKQEGEAIAKHFNRLVAGNSMKWGEVCMAPNRCDFTNADKIAEFARQHQLKMTGHTFVWHQMYPAWLFKEGNGKVSKEKLAERLRTHIFQMVERYADVVDNWDVVNEAISDKPGKLYRDGGENSKWFEVFGSEAYVELAFQYAAEAVAKFAPDTKLYYNDYNLENQDKRDKALTLVRALRKKGIRVDGVGIQGHVNLSWPTADQLRLCIQQFAQEKLLVKVSELDVSVYTEDDFDHKKWQKEIALSDALDAKITARWMELFSVFREQSKNLASVTLWGVSDDFSWLNGWPLLRMNYPLLIDREHRPKQALRELLK